MSRPLKDGVDYFPFDVGFFRDKKMRLIRAEFGAKGVYIAIYLLTLIYETNGYFAKWDEEDSFLVSEGAGCGCSPEFIEEVVQGCIRRSIFDKRVFDMFGVLTSAGIQRRYLRIVGGNRDNIRICEEYFLLDRASKKDVPTGILNNLVFFSVFPAENGEKSTENDEKSTENAQSKVKESKGDKSIKGTKSDEPTYVPDVRALILNDKSEYRVTSEELRLWESIYPGVNVRAELNKMCGWCDANPTKRKTRKGIKRFINSWLSREQDSASQKSKSKTDVFDSLREGS